MTKEDRELMELKAELKRCQQQMKKMTIDLCLAESRERRRIAINLHDGLGQTLALMKAKLTRLQGDVVFSGFEKNITDLSHYLNQAISYSRSLAFEISSPVLYEIGLLPAIEDLSENLSKRQNVKFKVTSEGSEPLLSEEIRVLIFSSIKELMVNVIKHASVNEALIHLNLDKNISEISVKDKGKGFYVKENMSVDTGLQGLGLFNIKKRIEQIGGCFSIISIIGKGTEAKISFNSTTE